MTANSGVFIQARSPVRMLFLPGARARMATHLQGPGRMTPTATEIQDWIVARVSLLTETPPTAVDVRAPLTRYGLDSVARRSPRHRPGEMARLPVPRKPARRSSHDPGPVRLPGGANQPMSLEAEKEDVHLFPPVRPAIELAAGGWKRLHVPFFIVIQLVLILSIVHRFELAARNHLFPILCVAVGGFAVHAFLPARLRLGFFVLLSLGGIMFYLGWPNGAWVIGLGGGLIAVCSLPIPLLLRVAMIGLAALGLTMAGGNTTPRSGRSSARCSCFG